MMISSWSEPARRVLLLAGILVLWEITVRVFGVGPDRLPAPSAIVTAIANAPGAFAGAVATTLYEAILGIIGGTLIGFASGIACSRYRLIERMLLPYFVASQAVPIIAFGAIIIMWFGNGVASKALIALYLSFFPVAVATLAGIRTVRREEIGLLRTFGAGPATILVKLQLPAALPSVFTSMRLAAGLGLVGAIVGEWFGANRGLGVILLSAMYEQRMGELWAAILLTGLSGVALFGLVAVLQRSLAWWQLEV
jgi:NitT/TauT family transport system permease protein